MKKILAIALTIMLAFSLFGCTTNTDNEKITVMLDWTPNTNHTGLYVALEKGYYSELGLDVEIVIPPEDNVYPLVASGKAQFGIGFQETLASALTSDAPLPITSVAAVMQHNTSGIIALKSSGIDNFKAMENHNYATWNWPVEQKTLKYCVEKQGGDFNKIELIPSTVTDIVSALQTDIDTVWVYEAWEKVAVDIADVQYNFFKFSDAEPVLDFYTPIIVAQDDYIKNNEETVRKFLQATAKGYEYCVGNETESAEILLKHAPDLSRELVLESQKVITPYYIAEASQWGIVDNNRWSEFYDWMFQNKLIPTELGEKGYTNAYLPR